LTISHLAAEGLAALLAIPRLTFVTVRRVIVYHFVTILVLSGAKVQNIIKNEELRVKKFSADGHFFLILNS
jgi:hypothetical protein